MDRYTYCLLVSTALFGHYFWMSEAGCDKSSCDECVDSDYKFGFFGRRSCNWCPLNRQCYTDLSVIGSDCFASDVIITDQSKCQNYPTSEPYNQTLAVQLAHWSALAYVVPQNAGLYNLKRLISRQLDGEYKLLRYYSHSCGTSNSECDMLIAISHTRGDIILSFQGTDNYNQLIEQLTNSLDKSSSPNGLPGKVLKYNKDVHKIGYQCVKPYITSLITSHPNFRLTITGFSLGGAQAQLAAAAFVNEGVIDSDKLRVYTFGSPRVGDKTFANAFDQLVGTNWRVIREDDAVPMFPFSTLSDTYHTHGAVYIPGPTVTLQSEYIICDRNQGDPKCSYNLCFTDPSYCMARHVNYFIDLTHTYKYSSELTGTDNPTLMVDNSGCDVYKVQDDL